MKPIHLIKTKYSNGLVKKAKLLLFISFIILIPVTVNIVNSVFSKYEIYFQSPIIIKLQRILVVKERKVINPVVGTFGIKTATAKEIQNPRDLPIKDYICYVFKDDCETALKVVQCESGFNEESFNLNKGHSLDVGIWQINMYYHGHKKQCNVKDMFDPYKNTDCAYSIYLDSGNSFNPWVCYSKGLL